MIGYFNNFDIHSDSPLIPAVQYLSAKGFFRDYDVKPDDLIDEITAKRWVEIYRSIIDKNYRLEEIRPAIYTSTSSVSTEIFNKILLDKGVNSRIQTSSISLKRGQIIVFIYQSIKQILYKE